jgi:hypothetical protein
MLLDVPLASQTTPATAIGRNLEWGVIGFTLAGILIAMLGEGSRRLTGRTRGRVA